MVISQKTSLSCMALAVSFLIPACSYNHPNPMPSGYSYHHEEYKSPGPKPSSKVTVKQREYMNAAQAEQFRKAVYDLLERLTMRAGMPPKPVYVMAPDPMTTFYANIDSDLREAMRHIGYAISDVPTDAYVFTYEALPVATQNKSVPSTGADNVILTLRVYSFNGDEAQQLTEETGQYFIQGAEALNIKSSFDGYFSKQEQVSQHEISDSFKIEMAEVAYSYQSKIDDKNAETLHHQIVPVQFKRPSRDDIIIINRGDVREDNVTATDAPMIVENPETVNPAPEKSDIDIDIKSHEGTMVKADDNVDAANADADADAVKKHDMIEKTIEDSKQEMDVPVAATAPAVPVDPMATAATAQPQIQTPTQPAPMDDAPEKLDAPETPKKTERARVSYPVDY